MPTLIRLIVILIFLGGLAFGGMLALTAMVQPGEKEIRIRIPARDLMGTDESGDPLNLRDQLPAPRVTTPENPPMPSQQTPPPADSTTSAPPPDMSTFE
jgi:hypothetical protein